MAKIPRAFEAPKIKQFKISDLSPAGYNPRVISDEAMAGLTASLAKFGCVEPIVVNIRGGKRRIVGGHQRAKALVEMHGSKHKASCVCVDLKPADEKLLNIALNNPQIQGDFSEDLAALIDKLRGQVKGDDLINMRIEDLRAELGQAEIEGKIPDDDIPKPPKKAKTKKGDLWLLGKHRLLCGDSTKEADVKRLMGRNKAALMATDPPYLVDYTGDDRPVEGKDRSDVFRKVDVCNATEFFDGSIRTAIEHVIPKAAIYLWHASNRRRIIEDVAAELKILIHQPIIWVKPTIMLGYSFYPWRFESCLLMWQKGHKPRVNKGQTFGGNVWPVGYDRTGDPTTPEYYTDVWELDWNGKKRRPGTIEHPTVKPVEIFAIPMRVHTKEDDICYEPFCGSGSQIIAAEKLHRRCFAMEIEPIFCDVAVKRWEEWTGKKAKLQAGGNGKRGRDALDTTKGGSTGSVRSRSSHTRRRGRPKSG